MKISAYTISAKLKNEKILYFDIDFEMALWYNIYEKVVTLKAVYILYYI